MKLLELLVKIAEAQGTFGCERKCDFPHNGAADRFKRVGDVVIVFRLGQNLENITLYVLKPGAPWGMGDTNYSWSQSGGSIAVMNDRQMTAVISRENFSGRPEWVRVYRLLREQWASMTADLTTGDLIAAAEAAMYRPKAG